MIKQQNSRFLYRANGLVVGGFLQRPTDELIDPQGGGARLAITGGYNSSRIENFRHRDILSIGSGHSMVSGRKSVDGERFETVVTSVIENLNILGIVTAERIVARVASFHPDQDGAEPSISPLGSYFQGLRVYGREVHYTCLTDSFRDPETCKELSTFSSMEKKIRGDDKLKGHILPDEGWEAKGLLPLSLMRDLRLGDDEDCLPGNFIEIPDFGVVYLGELIVSQQTRRLTMLRVQLGCAVDGEVSAADVEGDGHRVP
jgi:hypothetical protein